MEVSNHPPESARARQRRKVAARQVEQRIAVDDDVFTVVRVLDEAVGLALGQVEPPLDVAYAEGETMTGTGLEWHSEVAKGEAG